MNASKQGQSYIEDKGATAPFNIFKLFILMLFNFISLNLSSSF
jgi:hypothetical protein